MLAKCASEIGPETYKIYLTSQDVLSLQYTFERHGILTVVSCRTKRWYAASHLFPAFSGVSLKINCIRKFHVLEVKGSDMSLLYFEYSLTKSN